MTKDNLEIKEGNAIVSLPRDKALVTTFRKILEVYENELEIEMVKELEKPKSISKSKPEPKKIEEKTEEPEIEEMIREEDIKIPEPPKQQEEIDLDPVKVCPICNSKVKQKKVRQEGDKLIQTIKCKKWGCPFQKDYIINI